MYNTGKMRWATYIARHFSQTHLVTLLSKQSSFLKRGRLFALARQQVFEKKLFC
jgi:hypothetical protein